MKKFFKNRSLHLNHPFTEKDADLLIADLFKLNATRGDIYLQINSSGGSGPGAQKLYDNISLSPNPVIGVVVGDCFSMATMVLQACHKRYASNHARLHFHHVINPISLTLRHGDTIEGLKKTLLDGISLAKKNDKIQINIFEKKLKISGEEIIRIMDEDRPMTAEEALKIGLIDEIIEE